LYFLQFPHIMPALAWKQPIAAFLHSPLQGIENTDRMADFPQR
jgi:hypothetical protein